MAKRYTISPVVGNGTEANPYRALVSDVSLTISSAVIPSKPDGTPKYGFALCIVSTSNLAGVLAVLNSFTFPDYSLDAQMSGMESDTRNAMVQSVQAYNLDGQGLHFDATNADGDSYRELLTRLGRQLDPVFNLDHFDVPEITQ